MITNHAIKRSKQRHGINASAATKNAERALAMGITQEEAHGDLKRYMDTLLLKNQGTDDVRIYSYSVYIYAENTLITTFALPQGYRRAFEKVRDRINRESLLIRQQGPMEEDAVNRNLTLDSREVAVMVEKQHPHLLRDIETYIGYMEKSEEPKIGSSDAPNVGAEPNESKIGSVDFFIPATYVDGKGETRPRYDITKRGCEFLAHKMTGKKGTLFTATYINRFHDMEEALALPGGSTRQPVNLEHKRLEIEARHNNSVARKAAELRKLADKPEYPAEYKQILYGKITELLTGTLLLPLPEAERKVYSATEVGKRYGIDKAKVGRLANQNNLKTDYYGKLVWSKSEHGPKQVQTWVYYDTVFPVMDEIIKGLGA